MKWIACATLICAISSPAWGQPLSFNARVATDGTVTLHPMDDANTVEHTPTGVVPDVAYIVTSPDGDVVGAFASEEEAIARGLEPGEVVTAVAIENISTAAFNDYDYMRQIAREASIQLLQAARDSACSFDPRPESITPSVEVSFSLFAGGSFTVSATWLSKDICEQ